MKHILHVCSRESAQTLRDEVLRHHGHRVTSTAREQEARELFSEQRQGFDLVLIDVEGEGGVARAEKLCADIKKLSPHQKVAFLCNYRVSVHSDCPDEVIQSSFNPQALIQGVEQALG